MSTYLNGETRKLFEREAELIAQETERENKRKRRAGKFVSVPVVSFKKQGESLVSVATCENVRMTEASPTLHSPIVLTLESPFKDIREECEGIAKTYTKQTQAKNTAKAWWQFWK